MYIIVYDTSVIYASSFLENDVNLIDNLRKNHQIEFKIPEIVFDESINKLIENIREVNKAHQKNTHQIASRFISNGNLTNFTSDLISSDIQEKAVNLLSQRFREIGSIMPYPQRTQKEITLRAINRLKPFDGNGENGYRDTIIWETLKDLCKKANEEDIIIFICSNPKDFYDMAEWKNNNTVLDKELKKELKQINFNPDNFKCYKSLDVFWEFYSNQIKTVEKEEINKEEICTDEEIIVELKSRIVKKQFEKYINQEMFSEEDFKHEVTYEHDNIDIDYVGFISIQKIDDNIKRLNQDVICVKIKCDIEYTLGIYIFKADYFLDEGEIGFVEDWNKHYFRKEYSSTNEYDFELEYDMAISKILTLRKIGD